MQRGIRIINSLAAAARGAGLNALALANLHSWLVVDSRSAHAFLDLPRHCQKSLLDIRSVLRRGFQERDPKAVGEFLNQQHIASITHSARNEESHTKVWPHTLATVYSTTFLSSISLLFPTRSLLTPSVA